MAIGKGNLYFVDGGEGLYLAHYLTTYFEKVIVPLGAIVGDTYREKMGGDYLEYLEYGQLMCGFMYLSELNPEHFKIAYELTLKACDEDKGLNLYRDDFITAFENDPRFTQ